MKGFTLIELLIVVALISAIAVLVLSSLNPLEQIKKGSDASLLNTTTSVYNGLVRSYISIGKFPVSGDIFAEPLNSSAGKAVISSLEDTKELKSNFIGLSPNASNIYLTATQQGKLISLCFQPQSKSFQKNSQTIYDKYGNTADCSQAPCYICVGDTQPSICKTQDSECIVNNSNNSCCEGLSCIPYNEESGSGKCEISQIPSGSNCHATQHFSSVTNIDSWEAPPMSGSSTTDFDRITHALEWYAVENGAYPECGCDGMWTNASSCLTDLLAPYMREPERLKTSYEYMRYKSVNSNGLSYDYCLSAPYNYGSKPVNSHCPTGHSDSSFGYFYKGPESPEPKIPFSNVWPVVSNKTATSQDAIRKQDVNNIAAALSAYKRGHGTYPPVYINPWMQFTNLSNFYPYLSGYLNGEVNDPDGKHAYNISLSGDNACVLSYMDKAMNCSNTCGRPMVYWYYDFCYGQRVPE